jgi:hypothetical protein
MQDDMKLLREMLPFLIPLFVIQVSLLVIALVDVAKRKRVTGGNKVVWILIIVLVEVIGPIIYLAVGRKEDVVDGDQD